MTRFYGSPATSKPPAAISQLGRIVMAMPTGRSLALREIYGLAFAPHENFDSFKTIFRVAQLRDYVGRRGKRKYYQYYLTDKGVEVQRAIGA